MSMPYCAFTMFASLLLPFKHGVNTCLSSSLPLPLSSFISFVSLIFRTHLLHTSASVYPTLNVLLFLVTRYLSICFLCFALKDRLFLTHSSILHPLPISITRHHPLLVRLNEQY
jgi:hypothetical protein